MAYTESRPGFDANNRFNLPFMMPVDWKVFCAAVRSFYGLKENGNGKSAAVAAIASVAANGFT
jgi:hypothetical protein